MTRLFLLKLESPERRVRAASDVDINASGASDNPGSSGAAAAVALFFFFFTHYSHGVSAIRKAQVGAAKVRGKRKKSFQKLNKRSSYSKVACNALAKRDV